MKTLAMPRKFKPDSALPFATVTLLAVALAAAMTFALQPAEAADQLTPQIDRGFSPAADTQEDRQQLGIRQRRGTVRQKPDIPGNPCRRHSV